MLPRQGPNFWAHVISCWKTQTELADLLSRLALYLLSCPLLDLKPRVWEQELSGGSTHRSGMCYYNLQTPPLKMLACALLPLESQVLGRVKYALE